MRLEPGLDAETRARLEAGLRAVGLLRNLWRWTAVAFALGFAMLVAATLTRGPVPWLSVGLDVTGLLAWAFAACAFLLIIFIALVHRADIRRLEAFAKAMRGSSLARDIA